MSDTSRKILMNAARMGRVPNAYLFSGPDASVLLEEALSFAAVLNDTNEDRRRIKNSTHPDVLVISGAASSIKIDQIRELSSFARFGPTLASWKVVIVDRADRMTEEAANSFLKTLEEPADNVLFMLTTDRESRMLRTISSRCQKVPFREERPASDPAVKEIAERLRRVGQTDIPELLSFSEELSSNEALEDMLRSAITAYRTAVDASPMKELAAIKPVFNAVSSLQRHANKRLAMDSMVLAMKMKEGGCD